MKKNISFFILALFLSCTNDDTLPVMAACGVENPVEDLDWLKAEITRRETNPSPEMEYCFITLEEYENEIVFAYKDCNPRINKAIPLFNFAGQLLESEEDFENLGEFIKRTTIWTPQNFVCSPN
jgi:hypothetical protein